MGLSRYSGPVYGAKCLLWTVGPVTGSTVEIVTTQNDLEQIPLMVITPVIGAASVMFGLDCNQENTHGGGIRYDFISLTAVALSGN